jgi:hypothetical protein
MYGHTITLYKREPSGPLLNGVEYSRMVNGQITVIVKLQDGAEEPLSALAVTSIVDRRKTERHPELKAAPSQQPLPPGESSRPGFKLQADLFRQQSVVDAQQEMLTRQYAELGRKEKEIEDLKRCILTLEDTLREQTREIVCLYMVIEGFRAR